MQKTAQQGRELGRRRDERKGKCCAESVHTPVDRPALARGTAILCLPPRRAGDSLVSGTLLQNKASVVRKRDTSRYFEFQILSSMTSAAKLIKKLVKVHLNIVEREN